MFWLNFDCIEMEIWSNCLWFCDRRMAEKENSSPVTLDMKKVNGQGLLQVRTNPPSPQCFSAYREPLRRAKPPTPLKLSKASNAVSDLQIVRHMNEKAVLIY